MLFIYIVDVNSYKIPLCRRTRWFFLCRTQCTFIVNTTIDHVSFSYFKTRLSLQSYIFDHSICRISSENPSKPCCPVPTAQELKKPRIPMLGSRVYSVLLQGILTTMTTLTTVLFTANAVPVVFLIFLSIYPRRILQLPLPLPTVQVPIFLAQFSLHPLSIRHRLSPRRLEIWEILWVR